MSAAAVAVAIDQDAVLDAMQAYGRACRSLLIAQVEVDDASIPAEDRIRKLIACEHVVAETRQRMKDLEQQFNSLKGAALRATH